MLQGSCREVADRLLGCSAEVEQKYVQKFSSGGPRPDSQIVVPPVIERDKFTGLSGVVFFEIFDVQRKRALK